MSDIMQREEEQKVMIYVVCITFLFILFNGKEHLFQHVRWCDCVYTAS